MAKRFEYQLNLTNYRPSAATPALPISIRHPDLDDTDALAALMMDAYRGTIDFEGSETLADAVNEVQGYFNGRSGRPLLECSHLCFVEQSLVAACLVGWWQARERPLLYYIMTAAAWKGHGLGRYITDRSMQSAAAAGYREMVAIITEGNTPSERLFGRLGFVRA